jgi:hypothetical protein
MKTAGISDIKQALHNLAPNELIDLCLRLGKFKKENKELISFLLFEAQDTDGYIQSVKKMMEQEFKNVHTSNLYFAKKTLRKILRITNKHIKYTASAMVETEFLLHFCQLYNALAIPTHRSTALQNLYDQQIKKIQKSKAQLHEDLQYEYNKALLRLQTS